MSPFVIMTHGKPQNHRWGKDPYKSKKTWAFQCQLYIQQVMTYEKGSHLRSRNYILVESSNNVSELYEILAAEENWLVLFPKYAKMDVLVKAIWSGSGDRLE